MPAGAASRLTSRGATSGDEIIAVPAFALPGNGSPASNPSAVSYRSRFLVHPGRKLHLAEIDPSQTGKHASEDDARAAIERDLERLERLQYLMYAEGRRSLLIVLQALDAGGKDGTVRHVFCAFNPQGAYVHAFKAPTAEEAAHDFLWRVHAAAPERGKIAIFNRSHYEDILVPRVQGKLSKEAIEKRYERIVEFEKLLHQAGTQILKFYLHISREEQLKRFRARLDDPEKQWKLDLLDYAVRERWDDYRKAYEDALEATSTHRAPWYVIPSDHKWFRNLAVARIVADALDELGMKTPPPPPDLAEIRRAYENAAREELR
jgi:PPK2 family polyphosphate:nucleotide phosphotransferase